MLLSSVGRPTEPVVGRDAHDWRERAACRDEESELFFPVGTSGPAIWQASRAKAVCHRCPVVEECLDFALRTGQDHGIWGGMTEDERRVLRRRRKGA